MPRFEVAHLREQGVDLIVVPLTSAFGFKSQREQNDVQDELQLRANRAGLRGTVVLVWDGGGGRMSFLAPPGYHPFFRSIGLREIAMSVNRELYW
jgi:hypothetical protein